MRFPTVFLLAAITAGSAGCRSGGGDADAGSAQHAHVHADMTTHAVAAAAQPPRGERAPWRIDGDRVLVNNRVCAVSRTPMPEAGLGTYVSEVAYEGPIQVFRGKRMVFNQCCGMCVESFPTLWAAKRDEIMKFHGLVD